MNLELQPYWHEMTDNPAAPAPLVMVVDDSPGSLGMLCDVLRAEGFTVLIARDGETALSRLELVTPDAILLDAVMPGLSGFEVCRVAKANPALAHIPIIFMTGLSETEDVVQGFAAGGVDYVVKPLRAQEVVARLQTHTRNARITRLARQAVDVAGFGVVLVDSLGRMSWRSPQAHAWLDKLHAKPVKNQLPSQISSAWLAAANVGQSQLTLPMQGGLLSVRNMGAIGMGETMLLLEQLRQTGASAEVKAGPAVVASRLSTAALTPRETEVLSWLAKGKTNRDIGDILGMSHRTVNKHLEHIFEKLGVETRSAAAMVATMQLA